MLPDVVHTSLMVRAIRTAWLALDAAGRTWVPVRRSWRLNERHYGGLQGLNKAETLEKFGERAGSCSGAGPTTRRRRRSSRAQESGVDERYADLPSDVVPVTECLADVVARMLPYWYDSIVPDLRADKTVLVAAHGNSLRALVKHLDGISDADIAQLNIPTAIPLRYTLDDDLKPVSSSYLDPEAAAVAAAAVANQGRK